MEGMDAAIYEDGERTGSVHLDERTFDYDGENERIREVLTRMERGEIIMTRPTAPTDKADTDDDAPTFDAKPGPDEANHRGGVESVAISGKMLGRHLRKSLTSGPHGEDVRIEAVDGTLDAERIELDDDSAEAPPASDDAANAGEAGKTAELLSEVEFEAEWGPPSDQSDSEE